MRDLQIDFTALSLVAPEKMRFRYMLEGGSRLAGRWHRRQAFYTNLQPGDYRFRVMASNNSGVWNEAGAALAFAILPAFYQTTWFRALYVAAFLALLGGVYKLRIRQVQLRWRREQQRRHLERLETEIAEARTFQQSLLPDREAFVNGLAICCRYMPCTGVGGDLYDYAAAKPGQTAVLIADVSGHGMSAAMLTGIVKSAFHASHVDGYEPLAVVQRVFSALAAFSPERFVTLFAALVAPDSCELRYVNAGHPPTLLWRGLRDFTWLEIRGRSSLRRSPRRRGKSSSSRSTSAISCCCTRTASQMCSQTPMAVQKRESGRRSNGTGRAVPDCLIRFSPTCSMIWRVVLSPTTSRSLL